MFLCKNVLVVFLNVKADTLEVDFPSSPLQLCVGAVVITYNSEVIGGCRHSGVDTEGYVQSLFNWSLIICVLLKHAVCCLFSG